MNYLLLEKELKKRTKFKYSWGRKQADKFDKLTGFIYKIDSFDSLTKEIEVKFKGNPQYINLKNYAFNRWYNFWSAKAVEHFFCEHTNVKPHANIKDKFTDFYINDIPFDHKTTVFPKGFKKSVPYAISHKNELIAWLYKNQSQQQRKHFKNRLFVVLVNYENVNEHWKLKSEIGLLHQKISTYLCKFDASNLYSFTHDNEVVKADIIWVIK
ncbi:MAG: hypothetical protein QM495_01920 [Lutibacter sp.]|uniref:hypothetical protein n=1 Tax=Lutibacter sp. TaxID=1925666 RepID=UPI00385FDC98